ncbi:MAG: hypothetical protein ACHQ50_01830 [Fimbriimonadales bacterium]
MLPFALLMTARATDAQKQTAPLPSVRLHFPPENGIVYGRPHVLIIFDVKGIFQTIDMKLDGREIPPSVFTYCRICAGDHTAILTSDVSWGAVVGHHVLTIEARDDGGRAVSIARHYRVDGSRPSLSGLSGHVLLPDAFVAAERTVTAGGSWSDGRSRADGIAGAAVGGRFPLEAAGAAGADSGISWKAQFLEQPGLWSMAGGQLRGHSYGVFSYRTEPSKLELTLGSGSGDLPRGWLGASYTLTGMTRGSHATGTLADALAVSELVTFEGEVDERGRVNFGAILLHPYGWSVGLYRVNMASRGGWRLAASFRFAVK